MEKVMGDIKSEAGNTGKEAVKTCLDNGQQEEDAVAVKELRGGMVAGEGGDAKGHI